MKTRIYDFLEGNVGQKAWFAIPGGLVAGTIQAYDPATGDFGLIDATYYTGSKVILLGDCYVLAHQVCAWGEGFPEPEED